MTERKEDRFMEWVQKEVGALNRLLQDPHPGLSTWCEMYAAKMANIADAWLYGWDGSTGKPHTKDTASLTKD